nr:immunoglobulin heavy chain junction region [Mus musculus]
LCKKPGTLCYGLL